MTDGREQMAGSSFNHEEHANNRHFDRLSLSSHFLRYRNSTRVRSFLQRNLFRLEDDVRRYFKRPIQDPLRIKNRVDSR